MVFSVALFLIVASINGPKTLIGIAIREIVPGDSAGLVSGFVGLVGQLGSTLAGSGIAYTLQIYGWESYPIILHIASFTSIALFAISYFACALPMSDRKIK